MTSWPSNFQKSVGLLLPPCVLGHRLRGQGCFFSISKVVGPLISAKEMELGPEGEVTQVDAKDRVLSQRRVFSSLKKSNRIFPARFWTCLGTVTVCSFLFLPFKMEMYSLCLFHPCIWKCVHFLVLRFTAGEESSLRMSHTSSFPHTWFRWALVEILELELMFEWVKIGGRAVGIRINIFLRRTWILRAEL